LSSQGSQRRGAGDVLLSGLQSARPLELLGNQPLVGVRDGL